MDNSSLIDDMPNITGNFSNDVYKHHETLYERIFLEVFTVVGFVSITANILLSFVIIKYKRMREDPTNKIFLHVNILEAIYLLTTPMILRLGMIFFMSPVHFAVFCVSYQIDTNVMFGVIWFMCLMVCDWYIKIYHKEKYVKFCGVYKFFVIVVYVLIALASSITVQFCFKHWMMMITQLLLMACTALLVVFLFVINILHAIKKKTIVVNSRSGNIGLAVANICLLCWLPILFYILVLMLGFYVNAPIFVLILFAIGHLSPVVNLIYLYNYDDNYHIFLKQVFTCSCSEYRNETLDNTVSYNDNNGVQIPENLAY